MRASERGKRGGEEGGSPHHPYGDFSPFLSFSILLTLVYQMLLGYLV